MPICNICEKRFKNNQGLEYHQTHAVCQKFTCSYCNRRFKSSLGLKYHVEHRICLPQEKITVAITQKSLYHSYTLSRDEIRLTDVMQSVQSDGCFGDILFESENIILKLIELSLANPKLDQYWSAYISNRRQPYITIYDGESWKIQPQAAEFDKLTQWALDKIGKYLQDNKAIAKRSYWTKYYLTKDQVERKTHSIHKGLRQGLFCTFSNLKNMLNEKSKMTGMKIKP